jgi:UDP-N-acetyl-D-glucosamine dehydrogenase
MTITAIAPDAVDLKDRSRFQQLLEKVEKKTARVGVIGLGYVGLPLISAFHRAGFHTLGFDNDPRKVQSLERGQSYIHHLDCEWLEPAVRDGRFQPTCEMSRLAEADCILVCVPTPLSASRDPDLTYVKSAAEQIARAARPGQLIVLESTTYPGTTRDVMQPILEAGGMKSGRDYFLAYSPEREDPGNPQFTARSIPKVVGGADAESLQLANTLYGLAVSRTVPVSSMEVAEACKILENTYRCVNIALVNELKVLFDRLKLDVWEVIDAASTKPFGFQAFYPGPGLGGHCIPIDPFYLSWLARCHETALRFVELAGEINTQMPEYVVQRVTDALNDRSKSVRGSHISVLGVAYKKDIDDPRESPSFRIMELLAERGAVISYSDPHIPTLPKMRSFDVPALASHPLDAAYLERQDCVLIATDHTAFDYGLIARHSPLIVDTRNAMARAGLGAEKTVKA